MSKYDLRGAHNPQIVEHIAGNMTTAATTTTTTNTNNTYNYASKSDTIGDDLAPSTSTSTQQQQKQNSNRVKEIPDSHAEEYKVKSKDKSLFQKPTDLDDSIKTDRTPPNLDPLTPKEMLIAGGLRKKSTEYPTMDDVLSDWDLLSAVPANASVPAAGGTSTHQLFNSGPSRLAFKIKSSNNAQYRLKPVFGFIEPGTSAPLEIIRLVGPPKEDKMVVQFAEVAADATDAQAPFKDGPAYGKIVILVSAT